LIDEDKLSPLDRRYLEEAKSSDYTKLLQYLRLSYESGRMEVRELKVMLVGSSHAGKTSLREALRSISSSRSQKQERYRRKKIKRTDGVDLVNVYLPSCDIQTIFWGLFLFSFFVSFCTLVQSIKFDLTIFFQ
jgi:GTPase SAR1 family protein